MTTPPRRALLAALVGTALLSGCAGAHTGRTRHGEPQGSSLAVGPFDGTLKLGFPPKDVKLGAKLGFSFPVIKNLDKEPLTLLGVKLLHVPQGVKVVRYALLSVLETDGQILDSRLGPRGDNDYARFPNHLAENVRIDSGLSPYYPVVITEITEAVDGSASGCEYRYEKGGRTYTQTLQCEFLFNDSGSNQ